MFKEISIIVLGILWLYLYIRILLHQMHMFQLNGYKNNEHRAWIKKNKSRLYNNAQRPEKKKLVFTPRVKRMIATSTVIVVAISLVVGLLLDMTLIPFVLIVFSILMPWYIILCNNINSPIEKSINQGFINDALDRLSKMPNMTIIGVTGSYGKTSVKFYLKQLLSAKYNVLVTPENYNTPMGVVRTIREHLNSTHEIFICEMGARYVGDIKELCDLVHPHHGIITSIGPQHLETFGSMDNIVSTKFELADAIGPDGMIFLNSDNEYITSKMSDFPQSISYRAISTGDGYSASEISLTPRGTSFTLTTPNGESERFQLRLVGEHNVINVVGAIAVAHKMGISLTELKVPVRRIQPVEHRMEMKPNGNVTIIDDAYNSNPVGSKAAVETLAMFEGTRILVTPGMVELGDAEEEYNYKFGTYAAKCCDYVILVGIERTKPIYKGCVDGGFEESKLFAYDTLQEALAQAYALPGGGHRYILLENDLPDNY